MKRFLACLAILFSFFTLHSSLSLAQPSVAGLFPLEGSGRVVYDFNGGWRFFRGDVAGAEAVTFDDGDWAVVTTPHSVETEGPEVSGCRNYQGVAWYRKHFVLPADMDGKQCTLYFEGVMGKQIIYVNGREVKKNFCGYLPISIDLTAAGVKAGENCLVAVMADNADDGSYPPGKPQYALDFTYHGGIYRDVWLIGRNAVALTDANEAGKVAGGGLFVWTESLVPAEKAVVGVQSDVKNTSAKAVKVTVQSVLRDAEGKKVAQGSRSLTLKAGESAVAEQMLSVKKPHAWSTDDPYLYALETRVVQNGRTVDGGITRVGIRTIEWRGEDGLWVNGVRQKQLIGGNRHQDFAIVGNAMPNSQQWRDAKRLYDAGFRIVRSAHYPQDPAFMDACDELGLFVIVATPGWQFWNNEPSFAEQVYQNTRDMIRRDRNHPCVILWEPILNETHFPGDFSLKSLEITKEEYPHPGRPGAAADLQSANVKDHYDVIYGGAAQAVGPNAPKQSVFRREWGDLVDDWYAHNAPNRACRAWGEQALRTQSLSLWESLGEMYQNQGHFTGGCLWHPFDHQRGYHPDPFYGGIYDQYRQPKASFYMMKSQLTEEPMVYIDQDMTPFSPSDIIVWSNCDSVRLTLYDGQRVETLPVVHKADQAPNAPVVFEGWWNFMESRRYTYSSKHLEKVSILAEGIKDGQVVCRDERRPSRRSVAIRLYADTMGRDLVADGNDVVVVVAEITDEAGQVRRLAKESVVFTVEGEGSVLLPEGEGSIDGGCRVPVEYGTAPVLVRSTHQPGRIVVHARVLHEGSVAPKEATLELNSVSSLLPACYQEEAAATAAQVANRQRTMTDEATLKQAFEEVGRQQKEFGQQ